MTDITWLLILAGVVAVCAITIRILGRIISWRITLPILAIAILTSAGLLDLAPILAELAHLTTHLFGATP